MGGADAETKDGGRSKCGCDDMAACEHGLSPANRCWIGDPDRLQPMLAGLRPRVLSSDSSRLCDRSGRHATASPDSSPETKRLISLQRTPGNSRSQKTPTIIRPTWALAERSLPSIRPLQLSVTTAELWGPAGNNAGCGVVVR